MISVYLYLGLILTLWIYILWTRRKFYKLYFQLPGPLGYPLLGLAHKLNRREEIIHEFYEHEKTYGSLFVSWLGPIPFMVVSEPQIAQDILTSPYCVDKCMNYGAVDDGTGRGLFSLQNPEWSRHRKLLNPAFSHNVLLSFMPTFNSAVNGLLEDLDILQGHGEVELSTVLQKFTLNVATLTTMGGNAVYQDNVRCTKESLLRSYQCVLEGMTKMIFTPWIRCRVIHWLLGDYRSYAKAKQEIHTFVGQMINEKLDVFRKQSKSELELSSDSMNSSSTADIKKNKKNCFIDIAIELLHRGDFTWKNIEDESKVIVFGAFETTANTLNYTLMLLAMFPKYQQKAFEEINTIFPQRDDFDVSYDDIQQMVYMDMVLNETMRVIAPVPLIARQSSQDFMLSNGIKVPKGIQIVIDIFNMHRRKDIWGPDACVFNPDNFLPSNMADKHSYAYIPFTKGIRSCIGWRYAFISLKITLARVLRKYRFTTNFNFHDLYFVEDITVKLRKSPLLELHLREA